MAAKKIKVDGPAISEILVADTDSESGAEAKDLEDEFSESEEELEASAQADEPQTATRRITNLGTASRKEHKIQPFVGPAKGLKNSEAPHTNKHSSPLSVLMLFFTKIFLLLVEQTNLYYQQHLDRQAGHSCRLSDIMTFIALSLQMGHIVKDTLHDY